MREPTDAVFVPPAGVTPLKKHLTAKAATPTSVSSVGIVSIYRHYANRCELAARNAPNEKMRAELSKMVPVWHEFASEHERRVREGRDIQVRRNPLLKGWM